MAQNRQLLWYFLLVGLVLALALAGYAGYALYPRFDLPAATGISLLLLAAAAGVASFFTPCSFPLLTALLARSIGEEDDQSALPRAVRYGIALGAGASVFLLLVGAGIALGAGALFERVTFTSTAGKVLRVVLGLALVALGLAQTGRLKLPFDRLTALATPIRRIQVKLREQHPARGFLVFGFGYILAGFG